MGLSDAGLIAYSWCELCLYWGYYSISSCIDSCITHTHTLLLFKSAQVIQVLLYNKNKLKLRATELAGLLKDALFKIIKSRTKVYVDFSSHV